MTSPLSAIAARHQAHWHADPYYRSVWFVGPMAAAVLAIALLFNPFDPGRPPNAPWPTAPAQQPASQPAAGRSNEPPPQPTAPAAPSSGTEGVSAAVQQYRDTCAGEKVDEALEACTYLIDHPLGWSDPWRAKAYFFRGRAHDRRHEGNEAVTDLNAAVDANPNDADVRNYRGDYWYKVGWYDGAKDDYLVATQAKPTWAVPLANLAETYRVKRELDLALSKITEASGLAPNDPWILAVKGRIEADRRPGSIPAPAWKGTTEASEQDQTACSGKNADEALETCTRLINTLSKSDPWLYKAFFYRGKLRWERGDTGDLGPNDLKAAIEANPSASEVYNYRADQWAKVGWYDSAKEDYMAASRADPTWAAPLAGLAETYRLTREYDLALAKIAEAKRLAPQDPWVLTVTGRIDADRQK